MSPDLKAAAVLMVQAFLVGLSGAMSPGSFLTVVIARTMRRGALSASLMLVGHAVLEALLLVGLAFGLHNVLRMPPVQLALAIVGGAVLLWMGWQLVRGAARGTLSPQLELAEDAGISASPAGAISQGIVVSLSNPYWTLWWATIGVKLASDGLAIGLPGVVAFFIGHELADIVWYGFVIGAVRLGRGLLTARVYTTVMALLGVVLLYMGARFVGHAFGIELPWIAL